MTYSPLYYNSVSRGSSRQTITNFQSSGNFSKATPVSVNTSSQLVPVDITSQTSVQAIVGLTSQNATAGANVSVVDNGRLEDITTTFSIGDAVYINYDNTLTNLKPDPTTPGFSAGMFCVFIGVVVKNEFDITKKDLKLMISIIGQL